MLDGSGDLVGATKMQEQSLQGFREAGDKRGESDVLLNLGNVLVERGEMALAKQKYDQAMSIAREIGYKHVESSIWNALVDVHLAQDRLQDARAAAQRAIAIRQESQEKANVARGQVQLARVAFWRKAKPPNQNNWRTKLLLSWSNRRWPVTQACVRPFSRGLC